MLLFLSFSNILKGYFIIYGGYLLYLEAKKNVPSMHVGNKILWVVVLVYDLVMLVLVALDEVDNKVANFLTNRAPST